MDAEAKRYGAEYWSGGIEIPDINLPVGDIVSNILSNINDSSFILQMGTMICLPLDVGTVVDTFGDNL